MKSGWRGKAERSGRSASIDKHRIGNWNPLQIFITTCMDLDLQEGEDRLKWRGDKSGCFSVKSYYEILLPSGGIETFLYRLAWQKGVPLKVCFFFWEVVWGSLLFTLPMDLKSMG